MQLPIAVGQSYSDINWTATHTMVQEPEMASFWLSELVSETAGYQRSIQIAASKNHCKDHNRFNCLLKSIDGELNTILNLASAIAKDKERPLHDQRKQHLGTHLTRLDIKGKYFVSHLIDFFDECELKQLGDEFAGERSTLRSRMGQMSDEGYSL
jgi:hypothetical protein